MLDFLLRLFRRETSSSTAKERLRLVLLSDHLALAPEVVEDLKRDLIAVMMRYVEVDESLCDVTFEQQDRSIAMLANIPILGMRSEARAAAAGRRGVGDAGGSAAGATAVAEPPSAGIDGQPPGASSERDVDSTETIEWTAASPEPHANGELSDGVRSETAVTAEIAGSEPDEAECAEEPQRDDLDRDAIDGAEEARQRRPRVDPETSSTVAVVTGVDDARVEAGAPGG